MYGGHSCPGGMGGVLLEGQAMTRDKAFKASVRERMAATGESYTTALRALTSDDRRPVRVRARALSPHGPLPVEDPRFVGGWTVTIDDPRQPGTGRHL